MMVEMPGPFGQMVAPAGKQGLPEERSRPWRGQMALGQFAIQNSLRNRDERTLIGGDPEEFRVRHGAVVNPKCLFLVPHPVTPCTASGPAGDALTPETERGNRSNRTIMPSSTLKTLIQSSFRMNTSEIIFALGDPAVKRRVDPPQGSWASGPKNRARQVTLRIVG